MWWRMTRGAAIRLLKAPAFHQQFLICTSQKLHHHAVSSTVGLNRGDRKYPACLLLITIDMKPILYAPAGEHEHCSTSGGWLASPTALRLLDVLGCARPEPAIAITATAAH